MWRMSKWDTLYTYIISSCFNRSSVNYKHKGIAGIATLSIHN